MEMFELSLNIPFKLFLHNCKYTYFACPASYAVTEILPLGIFLVKPVSCVLQRLGALSEPSGGRSLAFKYLLPVRKPQTGELSR